MGTLVFVKVAETGILANQTDQESTEQKLKKQVNMVSHGWVQEERGVG